MRLLIIVVLLFCHLPCWADAYYECYYVQGRVLDDKKKPLCNEDVLLVQGKHYTVFKTDNEGNYKTCILYTVAEGCKQGSTRFEDTDVAKELNGATLEFYYKGQHYSCPSFWQKFYNARGADTFVNTFTEAIASKSVVTCDVYLESRNRRDTCTNCDINRIDKDRAEINNRYRSMNSDTVRLFTEARKLQTKTYREYSNYPDSLDRNHIYTIPAFLDGISGDVYALNALLTRYFLHYELRNRMILKNGTIADAGINENLVRLMPVSKGKYLLYTNLADDFYCLTITTTSQGVIKEVYETEH